MELDEVRSAFEEAQPYAKTEKDARGVYKDNHVFYRFQFFNDGYEAGLESKQAEIDELKHQIEGYKSDIKARVELRRADQNLIDNLTESKKHWRDRAEQLEKDLMHAQAAADELRD